jgi:hypothetical protein
MDCLVFKNCNYPASFYKKFTQFYPEGVTYDSPGLPKATLDMGNPQNIFPRRGYINNVFKILYIPYGERWMLFSVTQGSLRQPWAEINIPFGE